MVERRAIDQGKNWVQISQAQNQTPPGKT